MYSTSPYAPLHFSRNSCKSFSFRSCSTRKKYSQFSYRTHEPNIFNWTLQGRKKKEKNSKIGDSTTLKMIFCHSFGHFRSLKMNDEKWSELICFSNEEPNRSHQCMKCDYDERDDDLPKWNVLFFSLFHTKCSKQWNAAVAAKEKSIRQWWKRESNVWIDPEHLNFNRIKLRYLLPIPNDRSNETQIILIVCTPRHTTCAYIKSNGKGAKNGQLNTYYGHFYMPAVLPNIKIF